MWVIFGEFWQRRQEGGNDFQLEILLVAVAVGPALQDADLVVESFDQAEADLVVRITVGGDAVPMAFYHARKLAVRFQPLPLEGVLPALEEGPRTPLGAVIPELPEGLLEQVGGVEPLVGGEQLLEGVPSIQGEVFAVGEQHIAVALDEAAVLTRQAPIFASAHLVEGIGQVAHDVKLVEDDASLGEVAGNGVAKRFPHVHHGQLDACALFRPQICEEAVEVDLLAPLAANPDRATAVQVADDDPVVVTLADRDLVDANGARGPHAGLGNLLLHVELVEFLDRTVVQALQLGHRLVRHVAAQFAHLQGKALGVARVLCQPVEVLYMHATTLRAAHAPALKFKVDTKSCHRQITHPLSALVVTVTAAMAAVGTHGGFFRRLSVTTRA